MAHAKVTGLRAAKGYNHRDRNVWRRTGHDWALVTLDTDLSAKAGFLGVAALDRVMFDKLEKSRAVFVQAGYSQDKAHVLSVHLGCRVKGFSFGRPILHHLCDAVHGDSGSPVFLFDGKRFRVAAIHVATARKKGKQSEGLAVPGKTYARAVAKPKGDGLPANARVDETAAMLLSRLGHPPTGDLAAAVRAFQARMGIEPTGKADVELVGRMIGTLKGSP